MSKKEKESKVENTKVKTTKDKKIKFARRTIIVLIVLAIFTIFTAISLRAEQLRFIGINEKYESVFLAKTQNRYTIFGIIFISIYVFIYILNKFTKKGLKKFFEEEKKEMPKLPNKSICIILALIGALVGTKMLADKYAILINAAVFGQTDPIFGVDIGYYMFTLPFIQTLLIFLMEVLAVSIVCTALYYVITLNTYFDGINGETLKTNIFVKQVLFLVVLMAIIFSTYIFISTQNILNSTMVTVGEKDETETELVGAGKTDVTVKLWGYRILSFVVIIAVLRLIRFIRKQNFKQGIISVLIVPAYLVCLFLVMVYFQTFHVGNNELDNESEYIGYNIKNTKEAYGIDIDQKSIDNYTAITSEQVQSNQSIIKNIPLITENVTLNAIAEHQENSVYYSYENTFLAVYKVNNENKLVYITPREILADASMSYNNKTLKYTHGYSAVISSATDSDGDGYAEYILSDFKNEKNFNIQEPRIYFGLETDSTIMVNTNFGKEYDYPITATNYQENVYDGESGLKLGFLDRLVLAISEKNFKLAFSSVISDDTKVISDRNVIKRAQTIFPDLLYDEEPYLVVNDEGKLIWVLDGYTRSNVYPYSQRTTIDIKGYKEDLNYIRNSVKVLIDAYNGTTTFYIVDKSDPIIMTYRNMYPDLFTEEELPADIQSHLVYPKFLYNIQADMINIYHDISEDTLYRADDIWQITTTASATNSALAGVQMKPYYTMLKLIDHDKPELGLIVTYNKYEKQNISSYLVGTVENGKSKLSLYKFKSETNVVGIMQLNNQIEQDATISAQLETLNTTGTKLIKEMIIVPINNSLLYVEPVYQVMLNESEIPVLKKVIVASGNTVAIGDTLEEGLENLFSDSYSVDLDIVNTDDINALIDSVIKANNNLNESLNSNNFEMIGKDISSLQNVIKQLEAARKLEIERLAEEALENSGDKEIDEETENNISNLTNILNTITNNSN